MSTYEEELEHSGQLIYTCSGTSMLPLIRLPGGLFSVMHFEKH